MTTRANLQGKKLDELRTIAASLEIADHETMQKSKLITAILGSDGFEASEEPAPVDLPEIEDRRSTDTDAADAEASDDDADEQPKAKQGGGQGKQQGGGGQGNG